MRDYNMKKIFIGIIILVVVIIAIVLILPSTQYQINKSLNPQGASTLDENVETLTVEDITPNKIDELLNAFDNCDIVTKNFVYDKYTFEIKITGKEDDKCLTLLTLIDAPGLEAFMVGSNANCKLTRAEIEALQENGNIANLDCQGPLYEIAKNF
jgi:uncharacterized alpha/beta hydrolase family protein